MGCVATASHAASCPAAARGGETRRRERHRRIARCAAASSSGVPSTHAIDGATAGHVGDLPSCVGWVKRVDSRGVDREFYVVGTVHTPGSASADEVRSVIERVRPQAVVLELDQERFDGVLATFMRDEDDDAARTQSQDSASTSSGMSLPYALASSARGYGADFVAGASAAEAIGALVVLGDAKARSLPDELRARITDDPLDLSRLARSLGYVARAFGSRGETRPLSSVPETAAAGIGEEARTVSFTAALAEDKGKLSPLVGPLGLLSLGTLAFVHDLTSGGGGVPTHAGGFGGGIHVSVSEALDALLTCAALVATGRSAEVLLEDRDEVLSTSAARASACVHGMRRGDLARVSYGFTANPELTAAAAERADGPSGTPCFTLRKPLGAGEVRRLNLFEPRWLSLMDRLAESNGGTLVGATLGCMLGVSRRYVAEEWLTRCRNGTCGGSDDGANLTGELTLPESNHRSGFRAADVVIEPWMRRARVLRCEEGRRSVTGDRKLEVWIEGQDDSTPGGYVPRVSSIAAHPAGYLCAVTDEDGGPEDRASVWAGAPANGAAGGPVRTVCVVGLAHCNGVIERLSTMDLERWR